MYIDDSRVAKYRLLSDFDFLLLRATLCYTYKTRTSWWINWESFIKSNLSLIKFNVRATNVSSNIKPIFNLLPHVVENFLTIVCTGLSDPCLKLYSVVGMAGRRHCPSQNAIKRNPVFSAVTHPAICNKTVVPSTNWRLTWRTLGVVSSLHCINRFRFTKR
jgi:hypothetical protein